MRHDSAPPVVEGTINRTISRYEITAVYTHPHAAVDIVLVHGLNSSPVSAWTARNGVFWPTDLLPAALLPTHANILVYGYNADVYRSHLSRSDSPSDNFIHQHAQTLITSLSLYRRGKGTHRNPLLWICHSLGGVLVKRALLYSADRQATSIFRSVYVSTFGIVFLGTPHAGADAASWGLTLRAMASAVLPRRIFETEGVLLRALCRDSEVLADINLRFLEIYHRFRIQMVHESQRTSILGTSIFVVDAKSASPPLPGVTYYGVEATHSQMCKFADSHAPGFITLSTDLRQWILDGPAAIHQRWAVEDQETRARVRSELQEKMAALASPRIPVGEELGGLDVAGGWKMAALEFCGWQLNRIRQCLSTRSSA